MSTNTPNEPGSKSDWNILFYLIGDGLISASMVSQLKAITDAGFEQDTNVLVYFDPNCNGKNARIFDVNAQRKKDYKPKNGEEKTVIGDGRNSFVRDIAEDCHIPSLPQIPAEITLRYFLEYARAYYPAKNHILFLMGHGVIVGNDAFLPDPDDNSAITLSDLGWILRTFADKVRADGDEFELVGFHSCSMSSVELLYELEGSARYMLGTQGAAFPGSWPYRQLLKKIFAAIEDEKKKKKLNAVAATNGAAQNGAAKNGNGNKSDLPTQIRDGLQSLSFHNSEDFWLAGFSSDISMCRLATPQVTSFRASIEKLSDALQQGLQDPCTTDSIQLAHLESQSYWEENYTDLVDFCSRLWNRCRGRDAVSIAIQRACEGVIKAINGQWPEDDKATTPATPDQRRSTDPQPLVVHSDYYGPAYQFSNGLSIYFPWRSPCNRVIETYRGYKFTREHGSKSWWSFLHRYFRTTQRTARKTRRPLRTAPEVTNSITWRVENNLLRTLSVDRILSLGPPPAGFQANGLQVQGGSTTKVDLSKVGGDLKKIAENLSTVGRDLSKVGGDLEGKVGGDLAKVGGDLEGKVGGDLEGKVGGDLAKIAGDLADKVGGDLAKLEADLSKVLGSLSKVGGDLSKVGGDLSSGKVGGDLSKVGGDLSKVGGDLSKVGGDLAGKVGGDLADKVGGDLAGKVGGDLAGKVGGDLGGLYGHTVVKNFASPENEFITSRPFGSGNEITATRPVETVEQEPARQSAG